MLRRTFVSTLAGTALASTIVAEHAAAQPNTTPPVSAAASRTAAATCNMALLATAAQAEWVGGNKRILGDDASTKLVQAALTARGFSATVDGWYGSGTRNAYARYQRSLGYTGIAANGLPGPTSLAKLASGRFQISHPVRLGSTTDRYGGKRVNTRTKNMLIAADALLPWNLTLTQGEYSPGLKASKKAHDGGGSVDISTDGYSPTQYWRTVQALRTVGFAAWFRTKPAFEDEHIHAMAIGDTDAHAVAAAQVADYIVGKDALRGEGLDNTPLRYRVPFTWWERYAGL